MFLHIWKFKIVLVCVLFIIAATTNVTAATLFYSNDFEQNSLEIKSGDAAWHPKAAKSPSDITLVNDPTGVAANKVMRVFMDGNPSGQNLEDDRLSYKHRAMLSFGNYINATSSQSGAMQFAAGKEYWFGFRYFVTTAAGANDEAKKAAISFSPMSSTVGEPTVILVGGNVLRIFPERYRDEKNNMIENKTFETAAPIKVGEWNDVIVRWVRNPYWLDSRLGRSREGRFVVWVNGKEYDRGPVYAGTDRETRGEKDPIVRYGIYFVEDRPGATYELFFDNIRVAEGGNGKDLVDPSKAVEQQISAPASPVLLVE